MIYSAVKGHAESDFSHFSIPSCEVSASARTVDSSSEFLSQREGSAEGNVKRAGARTEFFTERSVEDDSFLNSPNPAGQDAASRDVVGAVRSLHEENLKILESEQSVEPSSAATMGRDEIQKQNLTAEEVYTRLQALISERRYHEAAIEYRDALRNEDVTCVSQQTIKMLIPVITRLSWGDLLKRTLSFVHNHNVVLPTAVYNNALGILARFGETRPIELTIENMWNREMISHPNVMSYNNLIGSHFSNNDIDGAFAVLQSMKAHMVYPNHGTYHALIMGCIRRNAPRRAYETLLAVEQQRFYMNALVIGQLVVACADGDEVDALSQLITRFEDSMPRYSVEIERIAELKTAYHIQGDSKMSFSERAALRGEPRLEIGGIMSVMRAAYRAARPDIAERAMMWFDDWYPSTAVPSSAWYCLIGAHAASKDFKSAFTALARMRAAGFQPSLKELEESLIKPLSADLKVVDECYYRIMDSLSGQSAGRDGSEQKSQAASGPETPGCAPGTANDTSRESIVAENEKVVVTAGTSKDDMPTREEFTDSEPTASPDKGASVLRDEPKSEKLSLGEVLLARTAYDVNSRARNGSSAHINSEDYQMSIHELNCIIAACSMAGDLDRAFQTYDEVQKYGLPRNTDTFNALLLGCIADRHVPGGHRIVQEMESIGVPLDSESIHLMVRLNTRSGNVTEAQDLLRSASDKGIPISAASFQTLARLLMRRGEHAEVRALIHLAEENGTLPGAVTARVDGPFLKELKVLDGDLPEVAAVSRP